MKKIVGLMSIGLALFLMGCPARTLSPLFVETDRSHNPNLIGIWVNQDGEMYTFQKSDGKDYLVWCLDKEGEINALSVQLGKLGDEWFLDSYPKAKNDDYYLLPTHVISKIRLSGDTLRVASLESDYFKEIAQSGKLDSPHIFTGNDLVFTGSTEQLQKLILSLVGNEAAFPNPSTFVRRK